MIIIIVSPHAFVPVLKCLLRFIVGEDQRIAYKGGLGPDDYKLDEVDAWLNAKFGQAAQQAPSSSSNDVETGEAACGSFTATTSANE